MNKIDLFYGFLIGIAASFVGSFLFISLFTPYGFLEGIEAMSRKGFLGKLITLGAILNLFVFFILLKYRKDMMARGVILATFVLAITTLLV
jgi:hypothetical protein